MRVTNGYPGILPLPVISASRHLFGTSRRLERSIAVYRSDVSVSLTTFAVVILSPSSSFHFVSAAFQRPGSSARALSIRRNLLIASFLDGGSAASFLAEEISGLDHAIDFHASPISVFLSRSPAAPSFVASAGIVGNPNSIFRVSIRNASI